MTLGCLAMWFRQVMQQIRQDETQIVSGSSFLLLQVVVLTVRLAKKSSQFLVR